MTIYADSSFFISLHLIDARSQEAWRRISSLRDEVWLTPLNRAEFAHAVFLHAFRQAATAVEAERTINNLDQECESGIWQLVDLPGGTFARSTEPACRYGPTLGVRTLDSLHVACALELKADRFWSFDARQERLAVAAGLDTSP